MLEEYYNHIVVYLKNYFCFQKQQEKKTREKKTEGVMFAIGCGFIILLVFFFVCKILSRASNVVLC